MNNDHRRPKKIVVVGEGGVGKTRLVQRLTAPKTAPLDGDDIYCPTLGAQTAVWKRHHVVFWDIAGQDLYGGLRDGYLVNADAAILMFSCKESYQKIPWWYRDIIRMCGSSNKPIPTLLWGNRHSSSSSSSSWPPTSTIRFHRKQQHMTYTETNVQQAPLSTLRAIVMSLVQQIQEVGRDGGGGGGGGSGGGSGEDVD